MDVASKISLAFTAYDSLGLYADPTSRFTVSSKETGAADLIITCNILFWLLDGYGGNHLFLFLSCTLTRFRLTLSINYDT